MTRTTTAWLRGERLRSQSLDGAAASPLDVVRSLGAVQAQNAGAARWAIGARAPGSTAADIEEQFSAGRLVRSWTMRGTLHVVDSADLGWMLALTAERQRTAVAREMRLLGLDQAETDRACDVIAGAVAEYGPRTRAEIVDALESTGIDSTGERTYRYIREAALRGMVAWGPVRGKQPQLVPVPPLGDIDRDQALARFLLRYVRGHAPVTVHDFAWWSGLTVTDARRALDVAGPAIERVARDPVAEAPSRKRAEWLVLPGRGPSEAVSPAVGVHALPAWDEYVIGYGDRAPVLDPEFVARVTMSRNGVFLPTIVAGGHVVGTWRQSVERGSLLVEPEPFTRLTASARRGFEASAHRLARFQGLALRRADDGSAVRRASPQAAPTRS
jgi:hypothetical protein